MTDAMRSSGTFDKVKGLISDMIAGLEKEAGADATHKAFCDKELAETNEKKSDKTDEYEKLSTKIEMMAAQSARLKEEVAALRSELSKLAASQSEMDNVRKDEKALYETSQSGRPQARGADPE